MGRAVFFWPLFLPIKKSEVRKLKVSHDINVYLLRGGVKVITPFPLDRFNLNGQIFHLPSSFLPLQRKWLTQIQEYVFSQLARQLCSVPLSAKLYPIHRRACHTNRQPHTYKKRFQEIIKPDNMWKGCFQSSCYIRIWVQAYDTRQWIYESLRYQPISTNQLTKWYALTLTFAFSNEENQGKRKCNCWSCGD